MVTFVKTPRFNSEHMCTPRQMIWLFSLSLFFFLERMDGCVVVCLVCEDSKNILEFGMIKLSSRRTPQGNAVSLSSENRIGL